MAVGTIVKIYACYTRASAVPYDSGRSPALPPNITAAPGHYEDTEAAGALQLSASQIVLMAPAGCGLDQWTGSWHAVIATVDSGIVGPTHQH